MLMKLSFSKKLFFLLLLSGQIAYSQIKFSATITPAQINKDEYSQLKLIVENAKDVQEIMPPKLSNFYIISGPNQESGMSMVNGDVTKYVAISFIIKPKRPGTFIIPSVPVKANGSVFHSNPLSLKVINAASGNNTAGGGGIISPFNGINPFGDKPAEKPKQDYILKKGEKALMKIKKNILVKLDADKHSVYVGEPVIATYKLYTRLKSESNMARSPSFNGFSVIDLQLPDNSSYKTEIMDGKEYNVYTIRKAQLYPLQPGTLELEKAEIENNVHFVKEEYINQQQNIMGELWREFADEAVPPEGMEDYKITLESNPIDIIVKPLPELNKPLNFKGAVGNFSVDASLTKYNFTTDDVCELRLVISGSGNLQLITSPEIEWPEGIEGFEPKTVDDLLKSTIPVSGRKIINYPFTVYKPGVYELPVIEFSFFDPQHNKYRSVPTKPIKFSVGKGTAKPMEKALPGRPANDNGLNKFFNSQWPVVSVLAILILCGLVFWLKREAGKDKKKTPLTWGEEKNEFSHIGKVNFIAREDPLFEAGKCLHTNMRMEFYPLLNRSLLSFLSDKLMILPEDINKKLITEKMDSLGIDNDITLNLHFVFDEIEKQLYTPFAETEKMQDIFNRANEVVHLINRY